MSKTDNVQIKGYITIPPEGTWLSRICTDHPDWLLKIVSLLPVEPSGGNVLIVINGTGVSRWASELKPGDGIVSCHVLHEETNKILVNLKIDRTIILHEAIEMGIPIRYPIKVTAGRATAEFITERWRVDDFITKINKKGFTIEIQRIGRVRTTALLTETQEHILTTALKKKFFEIPRGIKLHELATEIGIGPSSLSENLRRIFKKLAVNYALEDDP